MALRWHDEYYDQLRRADVDRARDASRSIAIIAGWMEAEELTIEKMTRDRVLELFLLLARRTTDPEAVVPAGFDPDRQVTMAEAMTLPGVASKSTLKRRKAAGTLPFEQVGGRHLFRVRDIFRQSSGSGPDGGLQRGPRRIHGYSQEVLQKIYWVLDSVVAYARDHGIAAPADRGSFALPISDRPKTAKPKPVPLVTCRAIAAQMHAVHQTVFWLMRIMGLRIGEAYGILAKDIEDFGTGKAGVITIGRQGGRIFQSRSRVTGRIERSTAVDRGKTSNAVRTLVVPPALMDLIREVLRIFPADQVPEGDRRLVPGLQKFGEGGQAGFRAALKTAARQVGVQMRSAGSDGLDELFSLSTHELRKAAISELAWSQVDERWRLRWAGHAAGTDVQHRHYVLDDPVLRSGSAIASEIQNLIDNELGGRLITPTAIRCTTGSQPALTPYAEHIDTALAAIGWLEQPTDGGQPTVGAAEIAGLLGISPQAARRYLRAGTIPAAVHTARTRGTERRARLSDVEAFRERLDSLVTMNALAAEVGHDYHTVYQYVKVQRLETLRSGARGVVLPEKTASILREHYGVQNALHQRAVSITAAAKMLGMTRDAVIEALNSGNLTAAGKAYDGTRMITRESVAALCEAREKPAGTPSAGVAEPVSWSEACRQLELSSRELLALVKAGEIVRVDRGRARWVDRASLLGYLAKTSPEKLTFAVPN